MFFSHAAGLLTANAIPTTYKGEGITSIAFGENIKYVPDEAYKNGMIIDLKAAKILTEKGIDVGLRSWENIDGFFNESFDDLTTHVKAYDTAEFYKLEIDEKAEVLAYYTFVDGTKEEKLPSAYLYENKEGKRFLVYAFIGENQPYSSSLLWCYPRRKEIVKAIEWLSKGNSLPITSSDSPHLYCICKEDKKSIAAGYFNCTIDKTKNLKVEFNKKVKNLEFINCQGKVIDEKTAIIEKIDAYEFAGVSAEYK